MGAGDLILGSMRLYSKWSYGLSHLDTLSGTMYPANYSHPSSAATVTLALPGRDSLKATGLFIG